MILFPAIDLKGGNCVRLIKGDMNESTVFNTSPGGQAATFQSAGCEWLHVVDLDGAFAGRSINNEAIGSIIDSVKCPIQLGGGIRDLKSVEHWINRGISRVILGTAAMKNPEFVKESCKEFPERIVVGIDAREGSVSVEGWAKHSDMNILELADRFEDSGVSAIIYTDIDRDGVLSGVNIEGTLALASKVEIPVIASGGLSSIQELKNLLDEARGKIAGIICGRVLYENRINLEDALGILSHGGREC